MCQKGSKEDIIIDKEVLFVFLTNAQYFLKIFLRLSRLLKTKICWPHLKIRIMGVKMFLDHLVKRVSYTSNISEYIYNP